ncbi:homoserine O-acetyltransferase [Wenzhouxiangella sp. AB-CW3]|uniref:homoserine O-acetyltransferase MetX n=1 Tax=Wenzhouxiangella sp. AB-CW3 TaxID=2771012 RepID=UPI00168B8C5C|nr:homoserine O-acetyltransferase [Wenzhouxiangella sp. AB-CW3]QOC21510.1 homoserine O-acetyltransferase [Wenzhouxiangella sp. AB-CW3]
MGPATRYFDLDEPFPLYRGGKLPGLRLAWESWGTLDEHRSNAVLIFTGLSPGAHAASSGQDPEPGWWEEMIGPGKYIDTDRFFVLCVNSLGSCMGSTGPASINPGTGRPWRLDFPDLAIEDIARATRLVVEDLGISRLHAVIGPSMGGLTTMAWLKQFPESTDKVSLISTACSATPMAIAIRSLQREAVVTDRNFRDGQYTEDAWPEVGMRLARKLGMISYRSAREWQQRFGRQFQDYFPPTLFGMRFKVESYLETHARKFVGQFDPCCYLYLSRAMDMFDACDGDNSLKALFRRSFTGKALVIGVETDLLFPLYQQRELAKALEASGSEVVFEALPSLQGHDAFLADIDTFGPPIRQWLQSG